MNTEINYEISKLLKKKGFGLPTNGFYYSEEFKTKDVKFSDNINHNSHISKFSAPTITNVIMWLYEKYGIWLVVSYELNKETYKKEWFWVVIKDGEEVAYQYKDFKSPTESYLAAFTHVLNKII